MSSPQIQLLLFYNEIFFFHLGIWFNQICIVPHFIFFLINEVTQIVHIDTETYFRSGIRKFIISCYRAILCIVLASVRLKGKRHQMIFQHKWNNFQRTANADKLLMHLSCPTLFSLKLHLKGEKKITSICVQKANNSGAGDFTPSSQL